MESLIFFAEMVLVGAGAGIISGALGLGGGILMVPALLFFVEGIDPYTAKGTSLFIIVFIAAFNGWKQNRRLPVDWRLVAFLAGGSIVGGYLGGWLTSPAIIPDERIVLWIFIAFLLITALRTFVIQSREVQDTEVRPRRGASLGIGLVSGVVSGATGTGGGGVLVPLALIAGIVTNRRVVALSNLVMVATSASSTAAHLLATRTVDLPGTVGNVNLALAPLLLAGAVASSAFGRALNRRMSLKQRRAILGGLLLFITVQLLIRAVRG